ncbi:unnamed protein product [Ectocarpus fasciculatus]
MLDAFGEVTLPAPQDLGTSEKQAVERIFSLEEHTREIGSIAIRAWMATPRTLKRDVPDGLPVSNGNSNAAPVPHITGVDIITTAGSHDGSEGNEDEDLFFELSKSSASDSSSSTPLSIPASDSSASTPISMPGSLQSSGGTSAIIEPLATGASTHSVEGGGQFQVQQQQHASRNQREEPAVRVDPEKPNTPEEAVGTNIAELGHHSTVKTQTRGQQSPLESGAARSCETPSQSDNPPLDLAAAILPLIPSYPPGSAEIRVLVRSILLPAASVVPAAPPYVRISLQPGAYSIARGTPATLSHETVKRSTNEQQGSKFTSKGSCSTENVVEYLVGGGTRGLQVGHQVLVLPLGPDVARMVSGGTFGPSTPTLRLEIVSGRSLGRCNLALPEILRRPGSSFNNLHVLVWKSKERQGQSMRSNVRNEPNLGLEKNSQELFSRTQGSIALGEKTCGQYAAITGQINVDFGVVLTGKDEGSPSERESCEIQQTAGTVRVETMGIRIRNAEGGRVGLQLKQHVTGVVGISAALELGGETRSSAFDLGGGGRRGTTAGEWYSAGKELPQRGEILLKSSCTELDVLTLRLNTAPETKSSSGSSFLRRGEVAEKDRRMDAVTIAVSDINDIFEGGTKWVAMSHHCFKERQTGQKRNRFGLGTAEACGGQNAGATSRLEVQLRVSLFDTAPVMEHRHNRDVTPEQGMALKDPESWQKPSALADSNTREKAQVASMLAKSTTDDEPWRALDTWITSPRNRCTQARAIVSSLGEGRQVSPLGGATNAISPKTVLQRAGEVLLEVFAIHGQGIEGWPTAVSTREGHSGSNRRTSSSVGVGTPPPWWVRVTFSDRSGEKARGGEGGYFVVDSPPGLWSSLEASRSRRSGEEAIAAPPLQQSEADFCGVGKSWIVRWPRGNRVVVRCPVHWNLGQKMLPVVFFEVFRGQALAARSVLELPPIIAHQGHPLEFSHPCFGARLPTPGETDASFTPKENVDSGGTIRLDLRCSFTVSTDTASCQKGGRRHAAVGDAPKISRPRSAPENQGGTLYIQVMAIQNLDRRVRSALALPCSVIFSLPRHHSTSSSARRNDEVGRNPADRRASTAPEHCCGDGHVDERGTGQANAGRGDVAALGVEPQKQGSVVVLVSVLGEDGDGTPGIGINSTGGREKYSLSDNQIVLASTWLPIGDSVMQRGHLQDRWYPLRVSGNGWRSTSKACDIHLRIHFMPRRQHPTTGISAQLRSSGRTTIRNDAPGANVITVVLEEGRYLTHPDCPVGPLELFAEIVLHVEKSDGVGGSACNDVHGRAVRSPMMVSHLPLREGISSQKGLPSYAAAANLGKGASPCWRHALHIPLPPVLAATDCACHLDEAPDSSVGRRKSSDGHSPKRVLLSIVIKSAARRVISRHPSPVPPSLLTSASNHGLSSETIAERCLLLGVARVRLPSCLLSQSSDAPIRGWFNVTDEVTGAHRGKVRISVFPAGSSSYPQHNERSNTDPITVPCGCSRSEGRGGGNSNLEDHYRARQSTSLNELPPLGSKRQQTMNDFTEQSEDTAKEVEVLTWAGGGDGMNGLQRFGLLFVSIGDLVMHSFGKEVQQPRAAAGHSPELLQVVIALWRSQHHDESAANAGTPSNGGRMGSSQASLRVGANGDFGGVLAVDIPKFGGELPALDVRVHVDTPHGTLRTVYHGDVSLALCLSNSGRAVQEKKGLTRTSTDRRAQSGPPTSAHSKSNSKKGRMSKPSSFGGSHDDDSRSTTEARLASSGSGDDSSDPDKGLWSPEGCCTVNVTTTFVPNKRGVLQLVASELHFTPPSSSTLERWRNVTELHQRTEFESDVGANSPTGHLLAAGARAAEICAFLRVRVLPSGSWGFCRTFPLKLPKPADWGRDPLNAGTIHLPGDTGVTLAVDTSIHAIARKRDSMPCSSSPTTTATGSRSSSQDWAMVAEVEPLTLEVCLFDNDRVSSCSSLESPPFSFPSCLLGCGTMALTPLIIAGGGDSCNPRQGQEAAHQTRDANRSRAWEQTDFTEGERERDPFINAKHPNAAGLREIVLFEPVSGGRIASLTVDVTFSSHAPSVADVPPYQALSQFNRPYTIPDLSAVVWALKSAFYGLDPNDTGLVRLEDILEEIQDRWPREAPALGSRSAEPVVGNKRNFVDPSNKEAVHKGRVRRLLDRLVGIDTGVGGSHGDVNRLGSDSASVEGDSDRDGLTDYIRHLLIPRGSAGDDGFVSWEVWAALSETIASRMNHATQRENQPMSPAVATALVCQRAEGLRCTHTEVVGPSSGGVVRGTPPGKETNVDIANGTIHGGGTTTPTMRDRQTEGYCARRGGSAGYSGTKGFADVSVTASGELYGHGAEGHGDLSYSAIEDNSPTEIGASTRESKDPSHRATNRLNTVRARKGSGPRAGNASRRNLHQTLATSRRSWQSQQQHLRRTVPMNIDNRSFMRSSSSPSSPKVVATATGSGPINGAKTHRHQEVPGQHVAAKPVAGRRPVSAPAAMATPHSAGKKRELATAPTHAGVRSAHQYFYHTVPKTDTACRERDRSPLHQWNRTMVDAQRFAGGWEAKAMMDGGVRKVEQRSRDIVYEAARPEATCEAHLLDDVETNWIRTETAAAKRKASKYQMCMLEAQRALDKEQQRIQTLENRTLEVEEQLLQRDRTRIRQAARARIRLLELEREKARTYRRIAFKRKKARVEANVATKLQWTAKGFLQRRHFETEMLNVRALQQGARSMLQARRRHHHHSHRLLIALLLQKMWRGRSTRQRLAVHRERITLVQAIVRGHLQRKMVYNELAAHLRCRREAARTLQKYRRRLVLRRAYVLLRLAAVKVEASYRRWLAQRDSFQRRLAVRIIQVAARRFVFSSRRKRAANILQRAYRSVVRVRRCRTERKKILDAASVLRRAARAWVARRVVGRRREVQRRDRAAVTLQHTMWRHLWRRKQHRQHVAAALTLWKFMGGLSVTLSRLRKRRRSAAATRIQAVARRYISLVQTRAMLDMHRKQRAAATRIQAACRGRRCRVHMGTIRVEQEKCYASTMIQAAYRGHKRRVQMKALQTKRHACAVKMQTFLLQQRRNARFVSRCERERERERGALVLQRAWRSRTIGQDVNTQDEPITTTEQRRSSPAASPRPKPRCTLDRSNVQLAVEALAKGMRRRGVLNPISAENLSDSLALGKDDPMLEIALRQGLSHLEVALARSTGTVSTSIGLKRMTAESAAVAREGVDEALRHSLEELEQCLLRQRPPD